jgi:hypothetical protein
MAAAEWSCEIAEAFRVEGDFDRLRKNVGGHNGIAGDLAYDELFIELLPAGFNFLAIPNGFASQLVAIEAVLVHRQRLPDAFVKRGVVRLIEN